MVTRYDSTLVWLHLSPAVNRIEKKEVFFIFTLCVQDLEWS